MISFPYICFVNRPLPNKHHNYFQSSGLSPKYMAHIGTKHKTVLTSFCNKIEVNKEPVAKISPVHEDSVTCQSMNMVVLEEARYLPVSQKGI